VEGIAGSRRFAIDRAALLARAGGAHAVTIDLGTGDGRFVRHLARRAPKTFVIGVDLCRENLRDVSRRCSPNALYLIADALALPDDLAGLATRLTINFPWGSLLGGLLAADSGLYAGLRTLAAPDGATLTIRLNGRALAVAGWTPEAGTARVRASLERAGWALEPDLPLDRAALRGCGTSWAKRLADGEAALAVALHARLR
jgi:16S rRNA (adenine(1408)-N(1))-methyltransferase